MHIFRHLVFRKRRATFLISFSILSLLIATGSAYAIASGTRVWTRNTGDGIWNTLANVAVDGHGNVYTMGSRYQGNGYDFHLVKRGMTGKFKWKRTYNGPANKDDMAVALAVDPDNNVYLTGWSDAAGQDFDILTIKYDPHGTRQWVRRFDGGGGIKKRDHPADIAVDRGGRVYIFGTTDRENGMSDFVTIKYSSSGKRLWLRRYNGPGDRGDRAVALAYGGAGSVVVTGESADPTVGFHSATIKYNKDGRRQWIARHRAPTGPVALPRDIAVDGDGNVYIAGQQVGPRLTEDIFTIKYDRNGRRQWVNRRGGRGWVDFAMALAVDSSKNVYVSGTHGSGFDLISQTIKYGPFGDQRWIKQYGKGSTNYFFPSDIAIGKNGHVFVTGTGLDQFRTIKYSPRGTVVWARKQILKIPDFNYFGPTLAVDNMSRQVYISGYESMSTGIKTTRYAQ